jgi:hypothetical protein
MNNLKNIKIVNALIFMQKKSHLYLILYKIEYLYFIQKFYYMLV